MANDPEESSLVAKLDEDVASLQQTSDTEDPAGALQGNKQDFETKGITVNNNPLPAERTAREYVRQPVKVVAHRGASGYAPENTLASFAKAIELNADYLEMDVHRTKDGQLVVIHDGSIDRTTNGTGIISEMNLEDVQKQDAGTPFQAQFAGEKIPTFSEVLGLSYGKIGLMIEVKDAATYPGIEQQIADELIAHQMDKEDYNFNIIVYSLDYRVSQRVQSFFPKVKIAAFVNRSIYIEDDYLAEYAAFADYVHTHYGLVNSEVVDKIHSLGMQVYAWTIGPDPNLIQRLVESGVDGLVTGVPDQVQAGLD